MADKLLDHALGEGSYTEPTCYLALFTTEPTMPAGTGGTEVSGGSYGRVAMAGSMAAAAAGAIASDAAISFATATASWGLVLAIGVYDALTGGNLLWAAPLSSSATVGSGDTFSIPSGDLTGGLS